MFRREPNNSKVIVLISSQALSQMEFVSLVVRVMSIQVKLFVSGLTVPLYRTFFQFFVGVSFTVHEETVV